jgi:hypothetical protein
MVKLLEKSETRDIQSQALCNFKCFIYNERGERANLDEVLEATRMGSVLDIILKSVKLYGSPD